MISVKLQTDITTDPDIQANVTHNVYITVITLWVLPERWENVKISVTAVTP